GFTNALGAMIYPTYGQGELPQAFCRCAAVKGALYVLRLTVIALLLSKEILSQHMVINFSVTGPSPPFVPRAPNLPEECSESDDKGKVIEKVARYSKGFVCFEQVSSIRVLQLGSGLSFCPSKSLRAAMNFLVAPPLSENPQDTSCIQSVNVGDAKPTLLWKATFVQELEKASSGGGITSCPTPDGNLDYRKILESSEKLFHQICQEEFFPKTSASEKTEDDDDET
ncbi:hypothetical protein MKW92_019115, partial [Papaver armeniacum]